MCSVPNKCKFEPMSTIACKCSDINWKRTKILDRDQHAVLLMKCFVFSHGGTLRDRLMDGWVHLAHSWLG